MIDLEALKEGSAEAFEQLVAAYSQVVVKTCYGFVGQLDDAEDVGQEVFVEIYRSVKGFRDEASLRTWIYRICISKSLDFIRAKNRKKRLADLRGLFWAKQRPVQVAHEVMEEKERRRLLREQVAQLPEKQRIAIVLSQFQGLSQKEIGQVLQVTEKAVESLIYRGRETIRKRLEKYFEKNP